MFKKDWELEQLGYSSPVDNKIKVDFHLYENKIKEFAKKWNIETPKVLEKFEDYLKESNELNSASKFWVYLSLKSALDNGDSQTFKVNQELSLLSEPLAELLLFTDRIDTEIGADKLLELSNKYPDFKNVLNNTSNSVKYLLSEKEELVSMMLANAFSDDIYDTYTSSLEFEFNGKTISYTELWAKRTSEDREERKLAFELLAKEFAQEKNRAIFSEIYSKVCKTNTTSMKLRKIDGVMDSRNMSEEMDHLDVDSILDRVYQQYPLYQQYLKLKAKALGLEKLETCDVLAPIPEKDSKPMTYEEGSQFYLDIIKKIDEDIYNHSLSLLESGKVDAYPKKGKSGGAFCSYTKGSGEWVLLNWDETKGYVTTLAHELGHAFHGSVSNKQNFLNYSSSLCLAETASIFNETVLFNALLEDSDDKIALIANRLDDLFSTIFRQVAYVRFERKCHNAWKGNNPLSKEDYNEMWFTEMQELFGDAVEINKEQIEFGWMCIPHIYHTPFYCYAYSFGNILSLNVYQGYKLAKDKNEYMTKYKEFLSLGGSKRPKDAIKEVFELDINSSEFYNLGFDHIKELIAELESLL